MRSHMHAHSQVCGEVYTDWVSPALHVVYQVLGWFAFVAWSSSFYPQVVLNFRRKSVVGLNFDYLMLNFTKHSAYLLYNACMYFSPVVHRQYREKYGFSELIPVAFSDVAYSVHSVLLTVFTGYQVIIYEKGTQKVSMITVGISGGAWFAVAVCVTLAWSQGQWLWLVMDFNYLQVSITLIKYVPQVWMNYQRKSTDGYSIENILLDLCGGSANIVQMGVQSIDQGSLDNFLGNNGKLLFSLVVLIFDSIFVFQHYFLYCHREFSDNAYSIMDLKQNKEAKFEDDDTYAQSSEDGFMFHGRCFINISRRFSERFSDYSSYKEMQGSKYTHNPSYSTVIVE